MSCTNTEYTLHQLSPYIGKLKSVIARDLILEYSQPGDLLADPFCGCGTVPLEAAALRRRVFASDSSIYATTLTKAKLQAANSHHHALRQLDLSLVEVERQLLPDIQSIPEWVRCFFHPQTLREVARLAEHLKRKRRYFLLSALLGILHHQRPGFLSYPSSNLVPYLRSRKFPREIFPELYEYRAVAERLRAKLIRTMKRMPPPGFTEQVIAFRRSSVENVTLPADIDCVITSPPYMNALDYIRDNRLRLWFLDHTAPDKAENQRSNRPGFRRAIRALASKLQTSTSAHATCIFIVGEKTARNGESFPSRELTHTFLANAPDFKLVDMINDRIPDVRRSRRRLHGVKVENILVFRKTSI